MGGWCQGEIKHYGVRNTVVETLETEERIKRAFTPHWTHVPSSSRGRGEKMQINSLSEA